jgi:hypothetical protein
VSWALGYRCSEKNWLARVRVVMMKLTRFEITTQVLVRAERKNGYEIVFP